MSNTTKCPTSLTPKQLYCVLSDIAETASAIDRLAVFLNQCEDDDKPVFITSIGSLAQRIGMIADMAVVGNPGHSIQFNGGIVEWTMPPLFHDLSDCSHGD